MPLDARTDDVLIDLAKDLPTRRRRRHLGVVLAIGAGGVAGAEARYGLDLALPHTDGQFPWVTLMVNASGCLLIGALMVLLADLTSPHRLARPFLGVGVLGGYTTFSTFALDADQLVRAHRPGTALLYVAATATACLAAVWLGTMATQLAGYAILRARAARRRGDQ